MLAASSDISQENVDNSITEKDIAEIKWGQKSNKSDSDSESASSIFDFAVFIFDFIYFVAWSWR